MYNTQVDRVSYFNNMQNLFGKIDLKLQIAPRIERRFIFKMVKLVIMSMTHEQNLLIDFVFIATMFVSKNYQTSQRDIDQQLG